MSATVITVRNRVIENLRDFDRAKPVYSVPEYDIAIKGGYQILAARMPWPHVYTASGLTLGPLSDTFTLATNLGSDIRIRVRSSKLFLRKVTTDEMDSIRAGVTSPDGAAVPRYFAIWNAPATAGTDIQGRVWPPAKDAEACDIYYSKIPTALSSIALDADSVLFDESAVECLILKLSADLLDGMDDADVARLKINPKKSGLWRADMERTLYREAGLQHDIADVGRVQRWVA